MTASCIVRLLLITQALHMYWLLLQLLWTRCPRNQSLIDYREWFVNFIMRGNAPQFCISWLLQGMLGSHVPPEITAVASSFIHLLIVNDFKGFFMVLCMRFLNGIRLLASVWPNPNLFYFDWRVLVGTVQFLGWNLFFKSIVRFKFGIVWHLIWNWKYWGRGR